MINVSRTEKLAICLLVLAGLCFGVGFGHLSSAQSAQSVEVRLAERSPVSGAVGYAVPASGASIGVTIPHYHTCNDGQDNDGDGTRDHISSTLRGSTIGTAGTPDLGCGSTDDSSETPDNTTTVTLDVTGVNGTIVGQQGGTFTIAWDAKGFYGCSVYRNTTNPANIIATADTNSAHSVARSGRAVMAAAGQALTGSGNIFRDSYDNYNDSQNSFLAKIIPYRADSGQAVTAAIARVFDGGVESLSRYNVAQITPGVTYDPGSEDNRTKVLAPGSLSLTLEKTTKFILDCPAVHARSEVTAHVIPRKVEQ